MTVAANCKQVLTIAIAVVMFNLSINFTNGIGIVLTLIGGVSGISGIRGTLAEHKSPLVGMVRMARIHRTQCKDSADCKTDESECRCLMTLSPIIRAIITQTQCTSYLARRDSQEQTAPQ